MKRTMSGVIFGLIFFVVVGLMIPKDVGIIAIGMSLGIAFAAGFIIGDTKYVSEHVSSFLKHIDERRRKEDSEFAAYKKQEKEEKMRQAHRVDVLRHNEEPHVKITTNAEWQDGMLR